MRIMQDIFSQRGGATTDNTLDPSRTASLLSEHELEVTLGAREYSGYAISVVFRVLCEAVLQIDEEVADCHSGW